MSTITKERVAQFIKNPLDNGLTRGEQMELARIALASLEAEAVGFIARHKETGKFGSYLHPKGDWFKNGEYEVLNAYTAPPAPVSVPDLKELEAILDWILMLPCPTPKATHFAKRLAVVIDTCRAAMLQGADRPQNEPQNIPENIPATQFNPVADLYGLTSPTGGETSFTFDAVEARDFIDGGWSCQEYVELERFQEAITNHTEDKLAMVDHSGDSNNMVESVTTACELRDAVDAIRNSGIAIDGEKILADRDALNSPVIPDGWVACSERMPEVGVKVLCFPVNDEPIHATYNGQVWLQDISWSVSDESIDNVISCNVSHWMPLPAAPRQEAKNV
jgi:hypothetical protein